jgi:hypothetical protein
MGYSILKALHIVFMVSYFAGIFYLVRLFVYYKDTDSFTEPKKSILREQYIFMLRRLWNIILAPAGVLMVFFGILLIIFNIPLLKTPWFHLKLTALVGLGIYHFWAWKKVLHIKKLNGRDLNTLNIKLRQSNEVATFILFFVVFTVILKFQVIAYWWQLLLGFFTLIVIIILIVKLVNKK